MRSSSLTPNQARTFGRILKILIVPFSILLSAIGILWVQHFVSSYSGPVWLLFSYSGELVGVSLLGAGLPLLLSALFLGLGLAIHAGGKAVRAFRSRFYWMALLFVSLVSVVAFSISHGLYGGLTLTPSWATGAFFAGASLGVAYAWMRGRRLGVVSGFMEAYVMGTFSTFLSDVVRTFTGLARVSPGMAVVWGGGGLLDLLFWFGIYVTWAEVLAIVLLKGADRLSISTAKGEHSSGISGSIGRSYILISPAP